MSVSRAPARTGRRPGSTQTRDAIATAAQAAFAEVGYDGASVRAIARAAGVDPSLVLHFYGSKDALFQEVMQLPPAVAEAMVGLAGVPRAEVGRRLAELVVGALENPMSRPIVLGRIRSAVSHAHAAELVRDTVTRDLRSLAAALDVDRPDLRASLVGSEFIGVAIARHVVGVEPLASLPAAEVVDHLAVIFQRTLFEPLG